MWARPGPGFARPERRLDAAVVADLVRVPGIAGYSASRRALVDSDRGPVVLDAMDLTPIMRAGVDLTAAAPQVWARFADGEVLLAQPLAYRLNLRCRRGVAADHCAGAAQLPHRRRVSRVRQ